MKEIKKINNLKDRYSKRTRKHAISIYNYILYSCVIKGATRGRGLMGAEALLLAKSKLK